MPIYITGNQCDNCIAIERFLKATLGDIFLYNRAYYILLMQKLHFAIHNSIFSYCQSLLVVRIARGFALLYTLQQSFHF